jgi:U4/U6.U5 tri-snRNP-associated protein 2
MLMRKIWNPKNFKGHVSPHELMQAVSLASEKKFKIGEQKDPSQFIAWFLNTLNQGLRKQMKTSKAEWAKNKYTVIEDTFQGEVEVTMLKPMTGDATLL